ncbi:MAG: hypothetical protein ABI843_10755 [Dokdonella sp.]
MITRLFKTTAALALAALVFSLAGCADKANPDNVDRRAVERWNFLIARQAEKAYDYLTPGFQQTQTRENYAAAMNNRPVRWNAVKFNKKTCEAERCKVDVDVTFSVTVPGSHKATPATSTQSETWILSKGEWFYLPNS